MPQLRVLLNFTRGADTVPLDRARVVLNGLYTSDLWSVPPNPAPPILRTDLADELDVRKKEGAA